ncbi:MAG TPA: hypothetical protein VH559_03790, partial [Gemmatimonadaceae bacterium]
MVPFARLSAFVAVVGGLTLSALPAREPILGPGVSRELARQRAALITGVRYDLRLSVVARDTARGSVTVRFLTKRSADVVLDFRGPSLTKIAVNGSPARGTFNGAHLRLPASEIQRGENVVTADFTTPIAAAGASIIRFHDDKDGSDYLYTLLVPSDANLLFPCFDQPDLKAKLSLSLTV